MKASGLEIVNKKQKLNDWDGFQFVVFVEGVEEWEGISSG